MLDGENKVIDAAIGGDSSAFGQLYDHYHGKIYRFVAVKVATREEAEDITHQIFLNALQNLGGYKNIGLPFSSWLYRIARNQVIDYYRTRKMNIPLDTITQEEEAGTSSKVGHKEIEGETQMKLDMEAVMTAVRSLKQQYQDVILLRFVEDLSIQESAAILQKTEGAVKVMQYRAMSELRKLLEGQKSIHED